MKSPIYNYDYAVIGGDMRQVYLVNAFTQSGSRVCAYALCAKTDQGRCVDALSEICSASSCLIGPIPLSKNGDVLNQSTLKQALPIDQFLDYLKPGQTFFAGCIPEDFRLKAMDKGVRVFDLMKDAQLSIFNTLATAEGAICEAIQRSAINLHHSSCAVLGYGKCGGTLSSYLKGLFCHVYAVSNQGEERARAALVADQTGNLEAFQECAGSFDYVFNTIPAMVMDGKILEKMKRSVTIIDIASAPGGVDYEAARQLGLNAVLCPGLPGKYAPYSSARAVKEVIERSLKE